jgi:hypothetical protein
MYSYLSGPGGASHTHSPRAMLRLLRTLDTSDAVLGGDVEHGDTSKDNEA